MERNRPGQWLANQAIAIEIDLEAGFQSQGFRRGGTNAASGGLPAPGGIEAPNMQEVAGVVAPEDLVLLADGFGSEHLPGGGGVAGAEAKG